MKMRAPGFTGAWRALGLLTAGADDGTSEAGRASIADDWGRSESLDPDDVGDIADEGTGHRG
ncbi:MAG: hypothetical protein AB7O67_21740 [Vicinamibacterales bacterium]